MSYSDHFLSVVHPSARLYIHQVHSEVSVCMGVVLFCHYGVTNGKKWCCGVNNRLKVVCG